jgi:hypothetical protein
MTYRYQHRHWLLALLIGAAVWQGVRILGNDVNTHVIKPAISTSRASP